MANDFVRSLTLYMQRNYPNLGEMTNGSVVSVSNNTARVRVRGSTDTQDVDIPQGSKIERGNFCILLRPVGSIRWVLSGVYSNNPSGQSSTPVAPDEVEIAPPDGLRAIAYTNSYLFVEWDAAPQQVTAFEIQVSPTNDDTSLTTVLTTRGSHAVLPMVLQYVRVRCISPQFRFSSWTEWLLIDPATLAVPESVYYCSLYDFYGFRFLDGTRVIASP